jgi:hypothetical protein
MLEKGTQDAVPFSRPHPRSKPQTVAENLQGNWNIERGHVRANRGANFRHLVSEAILEQVGCEGG